MKILRLKILSPKGKIVRDIPFNKVGISFVFGDMKKPDNTRSTINSLGKTLLLKMIDYILGSNNDYIFMTRELNGYVLIAEVEYKNITYQVTRQIGDSTELYINEKPYSLKKYREFFGLERNKLDKQVLLESKKSLISPRANPSKDDYVSFLNLLSLDDLSIVTKEIYESQDYLKNLKDNKKNLIKTYGDIDERQIEEQIFFIDKKVEELKTNIERVSKKIKNIETSKLKGDIIEKFNIKNKRLKSLKSYIEKLKIEVERLNVFIEESNKIDISSNQIIKMYIKAKQEIPEIVKKELKEVEKFHKIVYQDRKTSLEDRRQQLIYEIEQENNKLVKVSKELDKLGAIIAENQVYKESIKLYEQYSGELQEYLFKQGQLSQIKTIDDQIQSEDSTLGDLFESAHKSHKKYTTKIEQYRNFIYDFIKNIYDDDVKTFFDLKIRKKHQIYRPIQIELNLIGDAGEGVTEVKKNVIDYLVYNYNSYLELFIQDSSCYNGIDPRQVSNMLIELNNIAETRNKQAIVAINKFQVYDDPDIMNFIDEYSVIVLSENNKLLGFDF